MERRRPLHLRVPRLRHIGACVAAGDQLLGAWTAARDCRPMRCIAGGASECRVGCRAAGTHGIRLLSVAGGRGLRRTRGQRSQGAPVPSVDALRLLMVGFVGVDGAAGRRSRVDRQPRQADVVGGRASRCSRCRRCTCQSTTCRTAGSSSWRVITVRCCWPLPCCTRTIRSRWPTCS